MMALAHSNAGSIQNTVVMPFIVAVIFQFYALRYQKEWFIRYNYVFAAAVNASVALCVICINLVSFGVGTPDNRSGMHFWELNSSNGLDYYCKGLNWDSK
jgi:hypothetical protein